MIKCMYFINKHVQSIKARRLGPLQETLRSIREAKSDVLDKIGAVALLTRMMALEESITQAAYPTLPYPTLPYHSKNAPRSCRPI